MENTDKPKKFWFQTPAFRIGIGVLAVIAVVLVVLFSEQIARLFDLFISKAAEARVMVITGDPAAGEFALGSGSSPDDSVFFDTTDGKLKLKPPGDG